MHTYNTKIISLQLKRFKRKNLSELARKLLQQLIFDADVMLEWSRLAVIRQINHHVNGAQYRLFLLSKEVDRRLTVE